jgi:hypothetical protein
MFIRYYIFILKIKVFSEYIKRTENNFQIEMKIKRKWEPEIKIDIFIQLYIKKSGLPNLISNKKLLLSFLAYLSYNFWL